MSTPCQAPSNVPAADLKNKVGVNSRLSSICLVSSGMPSVDEVFNEYYVRSQLTDKVTTHELSEK